MQTYNRNTELKHSNESSQKNKTDNEKIRSNDNYMMAFEMLLILKLEYGKGVYFSQTYIKEMYNT